MIFFTAIEVALMLLAIFGVVTQIIIPIIFNRKLFPSFRKEGKILSEITATEQALHEKELAAALKQKQDALNEVPTEKGNTNV
jgi:hypothetical protein